MIRLKIILFIILFYSSTAYAADYYIDYAAGSDSNNGTSISTSWKHCPGMPGFAGSYSHSEGDIFVFKGGVTWVAPIDRVLTIGYSGGSSTPDQYVGGQLCGQLGSSSCNGGVAWGSGYPVFDGNSAGGTIVYSYGKSNLIFNGIKLYNATMFPGGYGQGLQVRNASNLEVKNCWIETLNINAFSYMSDTGGSYSKIYFHDNHIRRTGRTAIQPTTDSFLDDVQVYNNLYEGPGDYGLGTAYHLDGFMIGGSNASLYAITNLKIYNNKFYGDWSTAAAGITALIYLNGDTVAGRPSTQHTVIYNNVVAYENNSWQGNTGRQVSNMVWVLGRHDDLKIYNNTISADATVAINEVPGSCIYIGYDDVSNLEIKNNIMSGCYHGVSFDNKVTSYPVIDYNVYNTLLGTHLIYSDMIAYNATCATIAASQALGGWETHGIETNPNFVSLPSDGVIGSGNWCLQPGSVARDAPGADLSSIFTADILGITRPQGTAWDIGAYEYNGGNNTSMIGVYNTKGMSGYYNANGMGMIGNVSN